NLAGSRIAPGAGDKATIGQSFNVVLAEDEDYCAAIGWPTFAMDRGFERGENVVTVQSEIYISPPTYSAGDRATDHMSIIRDVIGQQTLAYGSVVGMVYGKWFPLLLLGPGIARVFAQDGWSKDDIRRDLYENVRLPARELEGNAYSVGLTGFSFRNQVEKGILPGGYADSDDAERLLRCNLHPESIGIVV